MTIQKILKEKNMSVYRLSKVSEVPYMTCNDIVTGKAELEKCSAETVYKIARALKISMEELLAPYMIERTSFENFKSTICHRVKEMGDIAFIIDTLESGDIRMYYERKWYPECLYLLGMLDYISNQNDVPICSDYNDLRRCKLEEIVYPAGIIAISVVTHSKEIFEKAEAEAIPEFRRFNIIESEVRNVI